MRTRFLLAVLALAIVASLTVMMPPVSGSASTSLKVGDMAPDFTLKDQSGKDVSLHDFRGKKSVVLAFYVFAFSGG